jgi:hypothetical protein
MHLTCKNTPVKPDRRNWMTRSERLCEENLSMSLLKESNWSDAAQSSSINSGKSDCNNRANEEIENKWFEHGMVVLGLSTSHC